MKREELKLYLVTDRAAALSRDICEIVREAVEGGVTMVQYREKSGDDDYFRREALKLKNLLAQYKVPLIINDRVDIALETGADGVHIGQSDMDFNEARKLLGPDRIIGLSVENFEQIEEANRMDVDYIGISPVFSTPTKTDTAKPFGLKGLEKAAAMSVHPTVAIGGINEINAHDIMVRGADGIAVVSAVMSAADPRKAAQALLTEVERPRGEFEMISHIKSMFCVPEGVLGIGDDCAVLPQKNGMETLVSTDMLVEGVHFLADDIDPYSLGWKSAAVNISDIAAMGGAPAGSFLSFAKPETLSDKFIDEFLRGYRDLSERFGCPLLGGDTTGSAGGICINVTVLGECPSGQSVKRGGARPGDLICVSGTLGDSAAGLRIILEGIKRGPLENSLVDRHYRPLPRVGEGRAISEAGASSMMDISDGIGSDLRHILEASGTGAEVDVKSLPLSAELLEISERRGWDPAELAIDGGEDYELLFTIGRQEEKSLAIPHYIIGQITDRQGIRWIGDKKAHTGFKHF